MKNAATLLEETFLSVKEIRARTGFNDESHFVRDFKRAFGVSPTEYRRQCRDEENGNGQVLQSPDQ